MADEDYRDREQSGIKHHALKLYLQAASRILGPTKNLRYVDCCAGPWNSQTSDYSDTSFGVAITTLRDAVEHLAQRGVQTKIGCLLIETRQEPFKQLELFAKGANSDSVRVTARNWDFTERIDHIVQYCSGKGIFSFVFIDPWGWKLAGISQITPILRLAPGEVLINLMSSFISRFIKDGKTDFTDLLGENFPDLRSLSGADLEFAVVRKYCDLIKQKGNFKYVCALPIMDPDSDAISFYLIYATRHWKGVQVFKDVEKRTAQETHTVRASKQQRGREMRSGNAELFGPQVQYREHRYQQLSNQNKARAKEAIWSLIREQKTVAYEDCWAEALQLSAVYESDLREWLTEWEKQGKIRTAGLSPREKVLKVNSKHLIVLCN